MFVVVILGCRDKTLSIAGNDDDPSAHFPSFRPPKCLSDTRVFPQLEVPIKVKACGQLLELYMLSDPWPR